MNHRVVCRREGVVLGSIPHVAGTQFHLARRKGKAVEAKVVAYRSLPRTLVVYIRGDERLVRLPVVDEPAKGNRLRSFFQDNVFLLNDREDLGIIENMFQHISQRLVREGKGDLGKLVQQRGVIRKGVSR